MPREGSDVLDKLEASVVATDGCSMRKRGAVKKHQLQIASVTTQVAISRRITHFKLQLRIVWKKEGAGGEEHSMFKHGRSGVTMAIRPKHSYNAGTEHVGFSSTRQALPAPSAERRVVFGEYHDAGDRSIPRPRCKGAKYIL